MKNTKEHYGYMTIAIHWVVVVIIFGLFGLGFWMVDLGYYDPWYQDGPDLHQNIGIILAIIMVIRVLLKLFQIAPQPLANHSDIEKKAGHTVHLILYFLIFFIMTTGYLISTADGRNINVFGIFNVPSMGTLFVDQDDIAGFLHKYAAYSVMFAVLLHAAAAIKHHVIDKDNTLKRMLGHRQK